MGVVVVLTNIRSFPAPLQLFSSTKYILCTKGPLRKQKHALNAILYT